MRLACTIACPCNLNFRRIFNSGHPSGCKAAASGAAPPTSAGPTGQATTPVCPEGQHLHCKSGTCVRSSRRNLNSPANLLFNDVLFIQNMWQIPANEINRYISAFL